MGSLGPEDGLGCKRTVDENCDDEKKAGCDDEKKPEELPMPARAAPGAAAASSGGKGKAGKGERPLDSFALFKAVAKKKAATVVDEDVDPSKRKATPSSSLRYGAAAAAARRWPRYAAEVSTAAAAASGSPRLPDASAFPVTFRAWELGGFTAVCRIARAVHGEVWFIESEHSEPAAAKVLPTSAIVAAQRRQNAGAPSRAARERRSRLDQPDDVEDAYNELAVLSYLTDVAAHSPHVVQMLGAYQDSCSTYLVMEYCDEGDLFERVALQPVAENLRDSRRYLSEILEAVRHLHRNNVGHRDLSLENVLLRRGRCVLIDFAQAVSLRSPEGLVLRYFAEAGKRMYRGPELHIPPLELLEICCPCDAAAGDIVQVACEGGYRCEMQLPWGAVPGHFCWAAPLGYAAAPADVFAAGVCAFVLLTGRPPWSQALDTDPAFDCLRRFGAGALLKNSACETLCGTAADLLGRMLEVNPARRASVEDCLSSAWLADDFLGPELL